MAKSREKDNKNIRVGILYLSNDLVQKQANLVLSSSLGRDKRISSVKSIDYPTLVPIQLPRTDPFFSYSNTGYLAHTIKYIYQYPKNASVNSRPILREDRLDLEPIINWLDREKPKLVFVLDPLIRDIVLYARRRARLMVGVVAVCPRLSASSFWGGEEGDLWVVNFEENREQLEAEFVNEKKILVIGPLVDKKSIQSLNQPTARKKLGLKSGGFYIGFVADGLVVGAVEELLERIGAFPDRHLHLVVISNSEEARRRIERKAKDLLIEVVVFSRAEEDFYLKLKSLNLVVSLQDQLYLPDLLNLKLASIIIAKKNIDSWGEGELDILNQKGLIYKANDLKDVVWQLEMILKNKKIIKDLDANLAKIQPLANPVDILSSEIFKRLKA